MNTPTEKCSHPDCGFFKDGAGTGCRAMRDNACASERATEAGTPAKAVPVELKARIRDDTGPSHFGVRAEDCAAAENYAKWYASARAEEARRESAAEIEALHRRIAAETLRADQGWQRYESANKDRNAAREACAGQVEINNGYLREIDGLKTDAARYHWLRKARTISQNDRNVPWVVALDPREKIPTSVLRAGIDLDHAIDAAIASSADEVKP